MSIGERQQGITHNVLQLKNRAGFCPQNLIK